MSPSANYEQPAGLHPLTPLRPAEITTCVNVLNASFPKANPDQSLYFKAVTLLEPPKAEMLAWDEGRGNGPKPARLGYICYYIQGTEKLYEATVDLLRGKMISITPVKAGYHSWADPPEIMAAEKVALEDPEVQAEIRKLELPEGVIVVSDPWIYGSDGVDDQRRQYQCFLYLQDERDGPNPDSNHYAFPLTISPIVDVAAMKVVRIQHLPAGADATPTLPKKTTVPHANEYTPEHQKLRADLKPLQIVQPEGTSFTVTEEEGAKGTGAAVIEWQKWSFRTSFNHREGMVLHNVTYDGRSVFYRVALSEMNIPYADPRTPYHKKAAFDLGDAGAGIMSNDLKLGCDCLGSIYYLSGHLCTTTGEPLSMPNVICIHEQDSGIGFKHTNYRTGRAVVTRNRELVLQSILTVSNYEYILAFIFNQAGEMGYEVRATGILSTAPIEPGVEVPWGTVVHPGVLAQHHQHIFSLRVDPAIAGQENKIVYEEAHAMPPGPNNPFLIGYTTKETEITASGGFDTAVEHNRIFKMQSRDKKNPINGRNLGYKIGVTPFQKMLAHPDSFHHKRAEFADKAVYVTKYKEGELYSAGRWTNQSRGGEGIRASAQKHEELDGQPVVWVQFGLNHIPRIEDFPVMPVEVMKVTFKPVNFFEKNPALDVPPSTQEVNRSVLVSGSQSEQHHQPSADIGLAVNGNGSLETCCSNRTNGTNGHTNGVNGH